MPPTNDPVALATSPEFLTALLQRRGRLTRGRVVRALAEERFEAHATAVFRLRLAYDGAPPEAPRSAVAKVCGPAWYADTGVPELRFYTELMPAMAARLPESLAPAVLGVHDDPGARHGVLLLEDLGAAYAAPTLPCAPGVLERVVDALADVHAAWWEHPRLDAPDLLRPQPRVSRMSQALPPDGVARQAAAAAGAVDAFRARFADELSAADRRLLARLVAEWAPRFAARVGQGRGVTLLHGDCHLLGNVFVRRGGRHEGGPESPRFIDWEHHKRGLGPHDVAYALLPAESPDRVARDTALLRRYHARLLARGVAGYAWAQCVWDYRVALLTNLFQCAFQESLPWFARTAALARAWRSDDLLSE